MDAISLDRARNRPSLPSGWRLARLADVCTLNPRRPELNRRPGAQTSFVPMSAVSDIDGFIADRQARSYEEISRGFTYFADGDVLFAKITPCMQNGKHAVARGLIDGIGFGSTEFHVIRPGPEIISDWVHRFVRQPHVLDAAAEYFTGSVGQQRVPEEYMAGLEIPLPPLPEQKRIAAILDRQMEAVSHARTAAKERLRAFYQLSGKISHERIAVAAKSWPHESFGNVVQSYRNGLSRRAPADPAGKIVLRLADVTEGEIDFSALKRVGTTSSEMTRYELHAGDVLFVRVNGSKNLVGRCAVVRDLSEPVAYNDHLIRVKLKKNVEAEFVKLVMELPELRSAIVEGASTTAGQLTVNQDLLSALEVPVPELCEQRQLVAEIKAQHRAICEASIAAQELSAAIENLPAALLRSAFRGEL